MGNYLQCPETKSCEWLSLWFNQPHTELGSTQPVLIVRYAFPSMHGCTTFPAAVFSPFIPTATETHTLMNSFAQSSSVFLTNKLTFFPLQLPHIHGCNSSVHLCQTHTEICLHLNSKTTLGSKFSSLTAFFCHSVLIWADLYCAVCTFNAIILLMTQLAVVLGGLVKSLLSCILKRN